MAAPLQYLLITLKVVALQKSLLVIGEFLRLFVKTLPGTMLNRDTTNSDNFISKTKNYL